MMVGGLLVYDSPMNAEFRRRGNYNLLLVHMVGKNHKNTAALLVWSIMTR